MLKPRRSVALLAAATLTAVLGRSLSAGAQEPNPSATPTPTPSQPPCRVADALTVAPGLITATASARATVRYDPNSVVVVYAYTRPSTQYRAARTVTTDQDGVASFDVRPSANTRMKAVPRQFDCSPPPPGSEPSVVLNVRTALTIAAARNGVRDYTLSGGSLPARAGGLVVTVYRVADNGSMAMVGQARADAQTGRWNLRHVFTGAGRFRFVARTGADMQNAPGASNIRSVLVY
jgi:hypothetical protein